MENKKWPLQLCTAIFQFKFSKKSSINSLRYPFLFFLFLPDEYGLFPVLYGSFSSYAEAHDAMKDIKKLDNKDAWLLIEEL